MGYQFENLVLNNRSIVWNALGINAEEIVADNPYFQRTTKVHKGCQIDYLIHNKYNTLFACEIKFSRRELSVEQISIMQEKISKLVLPKKFSCFPVLIHVNGISDALEDKKYFAKIIDLKEVVRSES